MLKSPVFSVPVQRALAGTAATGGAVQSLYGLGPWHSSEGADQASRIFQGQPSEGADQSFSQWGSNSFIGQPSEGADQSGDIHGWLGWQASEGADQSYMDGHISHYMVSEGADQSYMDGHISHYMVSEGADQAHIGGPWPYGSEGADQANFASWAHWGPSEG